MNMAESGDVPNDFEGLTCDFCGATLEKGNSLKLQNCFHIFCRECVVSSIELQSTSVQIKCLVSDEYKCKGYMLDKEIKEIVSKTAYEEYSARVARLATKGMKNIFFCKSKSCSCICEYEEGRKIFHCPACGKENCLSCDAQHEGMDCEEYEKRINVEIRSGKTREMAVQNIDKEMKTEGWGQLTDIAETVSSGFGGKTPEEVVLAEIAHRDILLSTKEFECIICYNNVAVGQGVILQDCLHTFCRNCLIDVVKHSDTTEVKCPLNECTSSLSQREIKAIVPPALHDEFLNRSVKLAEVRMENTFHCQTADCTGWCIWEEPASIFWCPVCNMQNCLRCKLIHDGLSCKEFKDSLADNKNRAVQLENERKGEKKIQHLITNRTYMRCPKCKMLCQKISGCNHVVCAACKRHFNWKEKK